MRNRSHNYLSIDGGLSGLPVLYALSELFLLLKRKLNLNEDPLPCLWFGLMAGTGTGAIVALLLGKLRFTTAQATEAYKKLSPFIPLSPIHGEDERENATRAFEAAFIELLADAGLPADAPMFSCSMHAEEAKTALICMAMKEGLEYCHLIRTYGVQGIAPTNCTILQAARACIASSSSILPVNSTLTSSPLVLTNATDGYGNPTKELIQELELAFGGAGMVSALLSVKTESSTSQQHLTTIGDLGHIAQRCEREHQEVSTGLGSIPVYFRLDAEEIISLTNEELSQSLDSIAERLLRETSVVKCRDLKFAALVESTFKPRKSITSQFTGYSETLEALYNMHFSDPSRERYTPRISVLTGPDGIGKNQLALKFAAEYELFYPDSPVFLLDARSEMDLKLSIEDSMYSRGALYEGRPYHSWIAWLTRKQKNWLVVMFNVGNDLSLTLSSFLPQRNGGHILITSTDKKYSALAHDSAYHLDGLQKAESTALIRSALLKTESGDDIIHAEQISERLRGSPAAIALAAGYIRRHGGLADYLDRYQAIQDRLSSHKSSSMPTRVDISLVTAFQLGLDTLPPSSYNLIRLLSAFENSSIPHSMFRSAAERHFSYVAYRPDGQSDQEMNELANCLMHILCPNGDWNEEEFEKLISPCEEYSLVHVMRRGDDKFYSMHVLVQDWINRDEKDVQGYQVESLAARILASCIVFGENNEPLVYARQFLPHIRRIQPENSAAPDLYVLGMVLWKSGQPREAVGYFELCLQGQNRILQERDPATLRTMAYLASVLFESGKQEEALDLKRKALSLQTEVLGETHGETLRTMIGVSSFLFKMHNIEEAMKVQERVLEIQKSILGEDDLEILATLGRLAASYSRLNKEGRALGLRRDIYNRQKKILGDGHPETLLTALNLAHSLSNRGKEEGALDIRNGVLEAQLDLYGEEHLDTLKTLTGIAASLVIKEDHKGASSRLLKVYAMQKEMLGEDHRDTLLTMGNLANAFAKLKRHRSALELREEALKIQEQRLGEYHPETLKTRIGVASSLAGLGMYEEAIEQGEEVLRGQRLVYTPDYPVILRTSGSIAWYLFKMGRQEEGLKGKLDVLEKQKAVLGKKHRDTLLTMGNIRQIYFEMGRTTEASYMMQEMKRLGAKPRH